MKLWILIGSQEYVGEEEKTEIFSQIWELQMK